MSQILLLVTTGCKVAGLIVITPILVLLIPEVGIVWFLGWVSLKNFGM
jgi:hypothetical protein